MISMIAAIGKNNELGINNNLIWHLPGDLKYFKQVTLGKTIIMGRKCFESLPGLLPNRTSIIITRDINYKQEGAIIMHSVDEVLSYVQDKEEECFVIGGGKIYEQFLPYAHKLYLTEIEAESEADTYFPVFDKEDYTKTVISQNEDNNIKYKFVIYEKK